MIDIGPNLKELIESVIGLLAICFIWYLLFRDGA